MGPWRAASGQEVSAGKVKTPLCRLDALADGASIGVLPDERGRDQLLLVRQGTQVHGYVNRCPHYDRVRLGWKRNEFLNGDGDRIMCAAHGALFKIDDGSCVLGPCLGKSLSKVDLEISDEMIYLTSTIDDPGAVFPASA
jgi:nitrite reductase/ring-hydroxylating ferredoxin subunit